jgi:predicted adenylyl cyclase CyaB
MQGPRDSAAGRANVEIKVRCRDLATVRARAAGLATRHLGVDQQLDTYFAVPQGRLKLRESSASGGQLVPYLRPDERGPRRADYAVVPVEDPAALKRLLSEVLGVHCVVAKQREIFLVDNVRIHLDRVEDLGDFVELEAVFDGSAAAEAVERVRVEQLLHELGLGDTEPVPGSYEGLVVAPRREGD